MSAKSLFSLDVLGHFEALSVKENLVFRTHGSAAQHIGKTAELRQVRKIKSSQVGRCQQQQEKPQVKQLQEYALTQQFLGSQVHLSVAS